MHVILTGATGLVGAGVLDAMIRAKDITRISILSRRPVKMAEDAKDPRINVILHDDFTKYDSKVLEQLQGAQGCVWALGISQTKVNKDDYVRITKDFSLEAAKAFSSLATSEKEPFRFIYVSGEGATQSPGRFSALFARVKGETEQLLADMTASTPTLQADSVRPAFVDSKGHTAIEPYLPTKSGLESALHTVTGPPIRALYKSAWSPTPKLGEFLTDMAMGKLDSKLQGPGAFKLGTSWVIGNVGLRRVVGL